MAEPQPLEAGADQPRPSKRAKWRKLDDIQTVRLALAAVIKQVYDGKLAHDRGSVCVTGLKALAAIIYDADIDRRLRAVEERMREGNQ